MKDLGSEFDTISDEIYYLLSEGKVYQAYGNTPWFKKIEKSYKDVNEQNAKNIIKDMLDKMKELLGNQY